MPVKNRLLFGFLFIILLVAYYFLGTDYLRQRQQHEHLYAQIDDATRVLAQLPPPLTGLEQQLAAAQDNLTAVTAAFPSQVNSSRFINTILKLADDVGVKAIPLVTRPWSVENRGEHNYYVLRLNVSVRGSFAQLVEFTDKLETGEFPTLIIEGLSVSRYAEQSETGVGSETEIPVSASIDLAIYTRSVPVNKELAQ